MKGYILIVAFAALTVSTDTSIVRVSSSRSNLNLGHIATGDKLLYRTYVYQPAIPNAVQNQDVVYRGNLTTRITSILASEVGYTQYATPYIVGGGVNRYNVTLRITSARGYGYYYLVDIWGR